MSPKSLSKIPSSGPKSPGSGQNLSSKAASKFNISYGGSRFWYAIGFAAAVLVLAAATYVAYGRELMGWEQTLFLKINSWPDSWRLAFLAITALGSSWMAVAGVAAAFLAKMYWLAWRLAASVLVGYGAVFVLKFWVDRPRPEGLLGDAHVRTAETLAGFPSGHSAVAAILALTFLPYLPKVWRWFVVLPVIAAVGLSRIYLGVHVPLDVIGGVALGALVVCFIRILPHAIRTKLRLG